MVVRLLKKLGHKGVYNHFPVALFCYQARYGWVDCKRKEKMGMEKKSIENFSLEV